MMLNDRFLIYLDELFPNPLCELNYSKDYELLIAVVLSAQTTDKKVNLVTSCLFKKYDTLEKLSRADVLDIYEIIKSLGFKKKAFYVHEIASLLISKFDGVVPCQMEDLISLPGVGRKSANVFLSEYYKIPAIAVDTHVERVSKRLGFVSKDANVKEIENVLMKKYPSSIWGKLHLQMVLFGRYHCKAINPMCSNCKLRDVCKK